MTGTIVYYALGSDHISHAAVAWHTAPTNATFRRMSVCARTRRFVHELVGTSVCELDYALGTLSMYV